MMKRAGVVLMLCAVCIVACGDDDGGASGTSGSGGSGGTSGSGDQDSGGGNACPNLAGTWTIDEHCGGAPLIGMSVPVTQAGCEFTTSGPFAGFTGTVDEDGAFTMSGVANGATITCTGTATTTLLTQSCTGDCDVVLSK